MSEYAAPLRDMHFVLDELAELSNVAALPGLEEATADVVGAVLEEAAKLAAGVLAPLNRVGDAQGSRLADTGVQTPPGWTDAYRTFVEGGWNGLACDAAYGGQGLPRLVATAVEEMWNSANLSFSLCPMLTQSAVEALTLHGSPEQQARFLPHLVSGRWAGTMNLTESQAGSDLSAVRARAVPSGDHYLLSGQKIFITYGDHDLTDNIIHLVLARTPDAPPGVSGISLFIVPKYILDDNGEPDARNDVRCVSLEHKLGIHASPTAVMSYGDEGGATAYLVGEEHRGLEYMFTMMNFARHGVGLQGLAVAERAYQHALAYARQRVQGRPAGKKEGERVSIVHHPDVQRMLWLMKSQTEAMRALTYVAAAEFDWAHRHPDAAERRRHGALLDLLTPIVKGWCTETASEIADLGVQVHGGMGYIEETGAAQHLRDARITRIYEGTTGIQASDLVGRKVLRDGGAGARELIATLRAGAAALAQMPQYELGDVRVALEEGVDAVAAATDWVLGAAARDPRLPAAAALPYLMLWGTVCGGWQLARAAAAARRRLDAGDGDAAFLQAKIDTARFYALHVAPRVAGLRRSIEHGAATLVDLDMRGL